MLRWTAAHVLTFLFFLLFVAFLVYCLYIKYRHIKYDHIPGPPRDSFLLGHSPSFLKVMRNGGIVQDKLLEWSETYGPVYRINIFHFVLIGVTCPDTTKVNIYLFYHMLHKHQCKGHQKNPIPFINEVREACRLLRATGAQWIHDRKTAIQNGDDVPKDILTQIIKTAGQDEELMVDNFVTFFIAGQETTANQLAFCVMELGRHPEIMEKVKKEVDDVIGMKMDIRYEDLGQLTYLSQVLKETLRLYSTVPGTSRDILEDMVIDGIRIPGGFTCMLSSYVAGRMEKFFKDPLIFDPDRFHPDAPKPYYCYYPFALGPRSCLGQNFAQMEAKVVMAKLLQRFDFTLVPGQSFDILDTATLRPKGGVLCSIRHRKHSQ
uniref:Cholesterol 24-hydroxylase-like n=1 Tax=Sphaeramia orbicularis TaxID=375764 RepID=A0A672ZND9_9TELE